MDIHPIAGSSRRTFARSALAAGMLLGLSALPLSAGEPREKKDLWAALGSGEAVALMRHATAPGTGDPADFSLGDCATQRNLSADGRDEARRTGELFRANGIADAEILSSAWCRCRDTATLLGLGPVRSLEALNSFFGTPAESEARTRALAAWLLARKSTRPLVLVTHQVNITALTGVYPRSGETVVAQIGPDGTVAVIGSLPPAR